MWHVNKCEQVGRVVGFSKVGAPECQSILKVGGWILAAVKDSSVKRHLKRLNGSVKAHGGRCMACPGAQRGSSPEEKGLLGGEEGNPPAEVAWSQSSRAMTGRGGGVLPVGSQEPLQTLEQQNNLQIRA